MNKKEIGLYIHIPFCVHKCDYCDFISYANCEHNIDAYIEKLKEEILQEKLETYKITTIYIGGGTPSYIDSKYIIDILSLIDKSYTKEITLELNPGTITKQKLEDYKTAGINRLSIGLQSIDNNILKQINRIHTFEEFEEAYNLVNEVGFENVNIDLMIGLPNQKLADIDKTLNKIIELKPKHVSVYSLIIEEGTPLEEKISKGILKLPDEEKEREMYWKVKNILEANGYIHYEISNFAKQGFESKHNLNCWEQKEYIGVGVAAHSYIDKIRYSNTEDLNKYLLGTKKNRIIYENQKKEEEQKEFMLLGLRKIKGVNIQEFKNKFVYNPIYLYREELNKLVKNKLIEIDTNYIRLTKKGIDLANLVWEEFV